MLPSYLRAHWLSVIAGTFCVLVLGLVSSGPFTLLGPTLDILMSDADRFLLRDLVGDRLAAIYGFLGMSMEGSRSAYLREFCWWIIGLSFVRSFLMQTHWLLWEKTSEKIARDIRADLVDGLVSFDPTVRGTELREEGLSALLAVDLRTFREYIVHFFGGLPRELAQVVFYMASLILLSPKLFLVFCFGLTPAGLLVSKLGKKLKSRTNKVLDNYALISEWVQQRLIGIETIKHLRMEAQESESFGMRNLELLNSLFRAARTKAKTSPIMEFVAMVAFAGVILIALRMVHSGEVAAGVLLSFFSTLAILSQSVNKLSRYYNSNKEGATAFDRICATLNEMRKHRKVKIKAPEAQTLAPALLELRSVGFRYPSEASRALHDVSVRFERGKFYCICGSSGAGKSTLMKLVLGLLEPTEGQLVIDHDFDPSRELVYLPQNFQNMPGTIAQTEAYPEAQVDLQRVEWTLDQVGLWGDISKLPRRAETEFEGSNELLSGGQLQRLLLARLIYHDRRMILIDEGTSALDPQSEILILNKLQAMARAGSSVVVIAHRPATLEYADEIIQLEHGGIEVRGSLAELKRHDAFNNMWF